MKRRKLNLFFIICIVLSLLASSSFSTFATTKTKTKRMTVYNEVIKSGRYLYCCDKYRIYRYDLKTGKLLNLVKRKGFVDESYFAMKKKGNRIYCLLGTDEETDLYMLKCNKKSQKKLHKGIIYSTNYYVSKSRLYYSGYDEEFFVTRKVSRLNGKSAKKSNVNCKMKIRKSNADGYRVIVNDDLKGNVKTWLKLPGGKKKKLGEYTYPY